MFDVLKKIAQSEPVVEEIIEESVIDDTEAKTLAAQLLMTMVGVGNKVRVVEDSVFNAGKIGVITEMDDTVTIETHDGLVIVESAEVERLISLDDLKNDSLDLAFTDMYASILEGLESNDVDLELLNDDILNSMHEFIAESAYTEVTQADYANLVVTHLLKQFPKLPKGIVTEPTKYDLINKALSGE